MQKLSIIIPAYNEESTIKEILSKIYAVDLQPFGIEKEVVIVNDGSTDRTVEEIEAFMKMITDLEIKLITKENEGKGAAIRTAIQYTTGDIIIIQDADLEYDPEDYGNLISPIVEGVAEVVYGSRRLNKKNVQYSGLSFYLGGLVLTYLANILYNTRITDEPTCYKVFRAEVLKNIRLTCSRFEFCPEVTAKVARQKIKIHEVPIAYYPRSVEEGKKIKWKDGAEGIWTLIKYKIVD